MWSECFHKLSGFSHATNGLGGSVRGGKRHPGSQGYVGARLQRGEMPEKTSQHQRVQLVQIIIPLGLQKIPPTHMNNMNNWRNECWQQLLPGLPVHMETI